MASRDFPLRDARAVTRRRFLGLSAGAVGALGMGLFLGDRDWMMPVSAQVPSSRLDEFAKNVISGGPPKDGIPPIEDPKYVTVAEADKFLQPDEIVFGLDYKGVVKAFPQLILVWHEIVNDEIGGEKLSVTYCPLTGSTVGYKGKSKIDGKPHLRHVRQAGQQQPAYVRPPDRQHLAAGPRCWYCGAQQGAGA